MEKIPKNPILEFNPSTLKDIRECWNLQDGRMDQSVKLLEEWITKQKHFMNKDFGPVYLEKTLVACKGSVEKAKKQIDKLCTMKTLLPIFFIPGSLRENLGNILEISWMMPLPKLTEDHYRIFLFKIKDFATSDYMKYYQLTAAFSEYLLSADYTNGYIAIIDYRGANLLEIITKINIVEFQQIMTILIECYGARIKGIHILTESKAIDLFVKTLKTMLSAKIGSRIQVHRDVEGIYNVLDKTLLPLEYGGEEKSINLLRNEWLNILCSDEFERYLGMMKKSCTDESQRESTKFNDEIMGLPGSFRTLNVD